MSIPLRPLSMMLPCGVDDEQVVLPARVDAELALPAVPPVAARCCRGCVDRADRRIAKRRLRHREGQARTDARIRHFLRPFEQRQLAAHQDEDAVRRLGKDALHRAPRPLLVAGQLRQRLRPVLGDRVRSGLILAALRRVSGRRAARRRRRGADCSASRSRRNQRSARCSSPTPDRRSDRDALPPRAHDAPAPPSLTTWTLSGTVTSRCSFSGTSWSPIALIGSGRISFRLIDLEALLLQEVGDVGRTSPTRTAARCRRRGAQW